MNKIIAIASLVLGIGVFITGLAVNNSPPILRTTEDSAINVNYDAPCPNAMTNALIIVERTTGKAHARHVDHETRHTDYETSAQHSEFADESVALGSPSGGLFSTASARSYNPGQHYSKVPNVQYVKPACPLCTK